MGETGIGKLRLSELSEDGRLSDKQGKGECVWIGRKIRHMAQDLTKEES